MEQETLNKIINLLYIWGNQYLNYDIELSNGDRVGMSKERGLVYYETLCKNYNDGYAYDIKCINDKPFEYLNKILNKVKKSIINDIKNF